MNFKRFGSLLPDNPLCGISTYKDELNLATGACTRKIRKYELTGLEDWRLSSSLTGAYWCNNFNNDYDNSLFNIVSTFCTHYKSVANKIGFSNLSDRCMCLYCYNPTQTNYHELYIRDTSQNTLADFIAYLQQQYANGTPVTVWYVLATSTTETITVPTGLSGTEEGYLIQDGTPTPTNPIYPTANEVKVWNDVPYYIHKTDTDILTTLRDVVYVNDSNVTVGLKGNTEQSGTPSPTTPIQPSECGDLETSGAKAGQYKIPILNNSQTTNVYLGEVQTTRQIKKLVLTGEETGWASSQSLGRNRAYLGGGASNLLDSNFMCSHFESAEPNVPYPAVGKMSINTIGTIIFGIDVDVTLEAFKQFLAAQYANGTPVTVWYVLATPTTGIVNEPLRKIGDYADEVSGITIPVTAGANTLSIGTTLQPSEVTANYHGWHPVQSVHEAENGQWD